MISYLLGALQVGLYPKGHTETNQNAKHLNPDIRTPESKYLDLEMMRTTFNTCS